MIEMPDLNRLYRYIKKIITIGPPFRFVVRTGGRRRWTRSASDRPLAVPTMRVPPTLFFYDRKFGRGAISAAVFLEHALGGTADRTDPVIGNALERRSRGNVSIGVSLLRVINESAHGALVLIHAELLVAVANS
jgi:hypothetical protein